MKSDVTIYLQEPILTEGGTIIVLPKQVPLADIERSKTYPNPALSDERLDQRRPIAASDKRFGAVVSSPVSVVEFVYPQGGSYDFRILPSPEFANLDDQIQSRLIGVGDSGDLHPKTGEEVDIPVVQTIHVYGKAVSEGDSRTVDATARLGFLRERYKCTDFEGVLACDASKDHLGE